METQKPATPFEEVEPKAGSRCDCSSPKTRKDASPSLSANSDPHVQEISAIETQSLRRIAADSKKKWSHEEDRLLVQLRGEDMKWEEIAQRLPGRTSISCRLHYQNFLERRAEWSDHEKTKLAFLYHRYKKFMWDSISKELGMPWRAVEAEHWEQGQYELAKRAGVPPFETKHPSSSISHSSQTAYCPLSAVRPQDLPMDSQSYLQPTRYSSLPTEAPFPEGMPPLLPQGDRSPAHFRLMPVASHDHLPCHMRPSLPRIFEMDYHSYTCGYTTQANAEETQ